MDFKDHYKTLGLVRTAQGADIKKAYRKLARRHHPDISKLPDANARMVAVNEAHDVLSDPTRRWAYDNPGSEAATPQGPNHNHHANHRNGRSFRPAPQWSAEDFGFANGGRQDRGRAPEPSHGAFFEQVFDRTDHSAERSAYRGDYRSEYSARGTAAQRGSDHHARIELDLTDAYEGAQRSLALHSVAGDEGQGQGAAEHHLQVTIPRGVHAGQHIRLAGQGGSGQGGAPAGDLLLEVQFKPDARWRAEGRDVYQRLPLAPWEAAGGAALQIQTPGGAADVKVPAGWKRGRKLRLKDAGIPGAAGHPAGHLYLELEVALPAADSEAARAAYAALALAFPNFHARA